MSKTITITLTKAAEAYFNDIMYSLDLPHKRASHSDAINHALSELLFFEEINDQDLTSWMQDDSPEKYQEQLAKWKDQMLTDYDRRLLDKLKMKL